MPWMCTITLYIRISINISITIINFSIIIHQFANRQFHTQIVRVGSIEAETVGMNTTRSSRLSTSWAVTPLTPSDTFTVHDF